MGAEARATGAPGLEQGGQIAGPSGAKKARSSDASGQPANLDADDPLDDSEDDSANASDSDSDDDDAALLMAELQKIKQEKAMEDQEKVHKD